MKTAFFIIIILLFLVRNKQLTIPKENSNGIKGILALLIILHHCFQVYKGTPYLIWFQNTGAWICSMFFFISAYGLHSQEDKIRNSSFLSFAKNRIWKVLLPFLIITLGYQILIITTGNFNLIELIMKLKKGDTNLLLPYSWFVFTLIYLYTLTFLSTVFTRSDIKVLFMFLLITAYILIIKFVFHWGEWWYTSIYGYFLGIVCKKNFIPIHKLNIWRLCSIIALVLIYFYWPLKEMLMIVTPPYLSLILIYGICNLPINKICCKISFLNKISYEVYLFQGYAIIILCTTFEDNIITYLLAVYVVTLLLASTYYYIKKYIHSFS